MYKHINEYNNMKYIISILSILLFSVNSLFAQDNLTAAGLVMTENGEEIIGATVTLKENPGKGVITDTLSIPNMVHLWKKTS
jgi:hypothetical protein